MRAQGFWGVHHQQAYFDVRVFNPLATSNSQTSISTCFRSHDREKRRIYEQHVCEVERGSFTPLSFQHLVVLEDPLKSHIRDLLHYLPLKRSALQHCDFFDPVSIEFFTALVCHYVLLCLWGSRSADGHLLREIDFTLAASEGRLSLTD